MVEWTMECLCIAISKLTSSVSTLSDPQKAGKATTYVWNASIEDA